MTWPTPQEYNEAIQNPEICFKDVDLAGGDIELTPMGIPRSITGAFASVYKVSTKKGDWAVRCFLTDRPDQKERYQAISKYVLMDNLKYTVEFHYLDEGIKIRRRWYPVVKMNWVYGTTLETYLQDNYRSREAILDLREEFSALAEGLDKVGMAHGDLQHGNIIVTEKNGKKDLMLVDYDAMFVPDLAGKPSLELGHPNYQHPERTAYNYDTTVDNFSCWLIHHSLSIVALDPDLFKHFKGGDECILFRRKDLRSPEGSDLFDTLLNHQSEEIRDHATTILRMLWSEPHLIPELHHPQELVHLPDVKPVRNTTQSNKRKNEATETGKSQDLPQLTSYYSDGTRFEMEQKLDWTPGRKAYRKRAYKSKSLKQVLIAGAEKFSEFISNVQKTATPGLWLTLESNSAQKALNKGEYAKAAESYLKAFKVAYNRCDDDQTRQRVVRISLKLADVLTRMGNDEMATNYFYIAHKETRSYKSAPPWKAGVTGLLLSLNRYRRGDLDGALKLFLEEPAIIAHLEYILADRDFHCVDILDLLLKVSELKEIRKSRDTYHSVLVGCTSLHGRVVSSTSFETDSMCAYFYLYLAKESYKRNLIDQTMAYYSLFKSLAQSIISEQGGDRTDLLASLYVVPDSYKNQMESILGFCQSAEALVEGMESEHETDELLAREMSRMEKLSRKEILNCLEYRMRKHPGTMNFSSLLDKVDPKESRKVHSALKSGLIQYATVDDLASYVESTCARYSKKAMDVFFKELLPASETARILELSREITPETYEKILSYIKEPILEKGTSEDWLTYIERITPGKTKADIALLCSQAMKLRSLNFNLSQLIILYDRGEKIMVASLFKRYIDQEIKFHGTQAPVADIGLYIQLLMRVKEEKYASSFIRETLKVNDERILHDLVRSICVRSDQYALRLVYLLYINSRPYLRKYVFVSILELGHLDAFEAVIYNVLSGESKREMNILLDHLRWIQQFRQDLIMEKEIRSTSVNSYINKINNDLSERIDCFGESESEFIPSTFEEWRQQQS